MLTKADRVGSGKADQRNTSSAVRLGSCITGRDWQLVRSRKRNRNIHRVGRQLVASLQRSVLQGSTVPELDTLTPPRAHRSPVCVCARAHGCACLSVRWRLYVPSPLSLPVCFLSAGWPRLLAIPGASQTLSTIRCIDCFAVAVASNRCGCVHLQCTRHSAHRRSAAQFRCPLEQCCICRMVAPPIAMCCSGTGRARRRVVWT
jgi:hypothetical protein